MNIKKLIATVVFVLSAWMIAGAVHAQTNYDFTATFFGVTLTGTVTSTGADPSLPFTSISNLVSGGTPITFPIFPINGVYGYANQSAGGANNASVQFIIDVHSEFGFYETFYGTNTLGLLTGGNGFLAVYSSLALAQVNNPADASFSPPIDSFSITLSPVAPEMNASLIPQVGLLLGCLFFLFGHKKENTEQMTTA